MGISQGWVDEVEESDAPPGDLEVFFQDGLTVIRLSGELDMAMGPALDQIACVAVEREAPVLIQARALKFIDSTGLGFLAVLARAGRERGRPPVVIGASRLVRDTIELSGLVPVLELTDPDAT
jgi:anti-anti-sigma factor